MINRCLRCYGEFESKTHNAKFCVDCRHIVQKERSREAMRRKRKAGTMAGDLPTVSGSINKILRDMAAYNKKHGTQLSYGKYVEMVRKGGEK